MNRIKNYISGIITSDSNNYSPVYDPSKGEQSGEVVMSNTEDFNNIVSSSKKAFEIWSQVTPLKRSRVISRYKDILEKNKEILAKIVSSEHRKTLDLSLIHH